MEFSDHRRVEYDRAILEVAKSLREHTCGSARRLSKRTLRSSYSSRAFVDGWRVPVDFSDNKERSVDILVSQWFPRTPPRAALVDRPEHLAWPHIEHDGVLCLLPDSSEIDPTTPGEVALSVLDRSVTLVDDLIEGSIIERDFKEEFLTYWFYDCHDDSKDIIVLFDPAGPSRSLRCFTHDRLVYVAEDIDSLRRWIDHRFGSKTAGKAAKEVRPAALIWLEEPLLPGKYPKSGADLLELLDREHNDALSVLRESATTSHEECLVLLGAEGRGGPGVVAVRINRNRSNGSRKSKGRMHRGFRAGHVPERIAFERTFGRNVKVHRTQVERADAAWIHGRGQDRRSRALLEKVVTIFGCGSVGSSVAEHLARSGIGTIRLVDYDSLCWANVGRHALGADASGQKKSVALAERLQCNYPHLSIFGYDSQIERVIYEDTFGLPQSDLIVSATGNWTAESLLNEWHLRSGFGKPVLYGWTEDHAVSGSTVVIAPDSNCFACGIGRTGEPYLMATRWPDRPEVTTEPSCADHYQPYGAIELAYITAMIANTAIDEVLNPSTNSYRNIWFSSKIEDYGGMWSDAFAKLLDGQNTGSGIVTLDWSDNRCALCSKRR